MYALMFAFRTRFMRDAQDPTLFATGSLRQSCVPLGQKRNFALDLDDRSDCRFSFLNDTLAARYVKR